MYLPPKARFSHLLSLPEGENIGEAINDAILVSLLRNFSQIAVDADGDKFGKIYEYFLGNFARAEGQRGGEFLTPTTMVQLIVEIIQPHHGRLMDHSCGSGGMYVQSARFIKARKPKNGSDPESAEHPQGRSGFRGLTRFSNDPSNLIRIQCMGRTA